MDLHNAYLSVAERSVQAADSLIGNNIQESATFYSYHAFESMGGALCEKNGERYHPKSHPAKINLFKTVAHRCGIGVSVATVAIIAASIRNGCLYPNETAIGDFDTPDSRISISDAKDLLRRVKGVLKTVKRFI